MSITQHQHQLLLPSAASLPREHLAAIQHIINDALALQVRTLARQQPPPPYNAQRSVMQWFKPRMDMYESPSGSGDRPLVTATFELPGLRKDNIHIEVLGDRMVVSGDRRQYPVSQDVTKHVIQKDDDMNEEGDARDGTEEHMPVDHAATGDESAGYTVREIKRGRFRRTVPLPPGTKLEDVKAAMHDGILTVTFPGSARPIARSVPIA